MKPLVLLTALSLTVLGAASGPDRILGTWLTPNGLSKVEIAKCGDAYCGSIVWMQSPKNDANNSDPSMKGRPLVGAQIVNGFKYESGSAWSGGKLYAPERGKMADAKLVLAGDDSLEVHVSRGIAKKTVTWTRVK